MLGVRIGHQGQPFAQTVALPDPPDIVRQRVVMSVSGVPGSYPTEPDPDTIAIIRRYMPTWAVVVAVVGFFLLFVGLLALLVRNTETFDIRVTANRSGSGSVMTVSGVADIEIITRIQAVMMSGEPV